MSRFSASLTMVVLGRSEFNRDAVAHHVGHSVALGYVPPELAGDGEAFEIELLGEMKPARVVAAPLYDPNGGRMRS